MKTLSVLVVDDDPVIRHLLTQRLTRENYTVTVAKDGQEATALLQDAPFDVVLTDLMMPGEVGGIGVLEAAKAIKPDIEVVVITGHSSVDSAVEAMKKGAADYLEKPINFDELLLRLDKIAALQSILRSAQDLQQAMEVTEQEASVTIQNLEMRVSQLEHLRDSVEYVLQQENLPEDLRIRRALNAIAEAD